MEWIRANGELIGSLVVALGFVLALITAFAKVSGRVRVTSKTLAGALLLFSVAFVAGSVMYRQGSGGQVPSGPPPGSFSPSENSGASATHSQACRWATTPVQWDNNGLGQDALPKSGDALVVELDRCQTALLDGASFVLDDGTECRGGGSTLCVVLWQSSEPMSTTVRALDTASNFVGHTESDYQSALSDKAPKFWQFPNGASSGCDGAYVTVFINGQRIQTNQWLPRPPQ